MLGRNLDSLLAQSGASVLSETIPEWIKGDIQSKEQDHIKATHCGKITKAMGEISLQDDPYENYLKYCAYDGWPGIFYFDKNGKRVKITEASFENRKFTIKKIIPEGKKEITVM
jgi:methionyl-tRNA formyltransferase